MSMKATSIRITVLSAALCALTLAPAACKRKPQDSVSRDVPPALDAGATDAGAVIATTKDASITAEAGPPSPFTLVARENGRVDLQRIQNGPILATMRGNSGYAHVLSEDGSRSLLEPIASHHAETHSGMGWDMGRITGTWPDAVYVELAIAGGRSETVIEHYLIDVEKRTLTRKSFGADQHLAVTQRWSDGRLLVWIAESSSVMGPFPTRTGRFSVLAGPAAPAIPVLPKKAGPAEYGIVAYESGRIFVLAALDVGDHDWDRSYVWEIAGSGRPKPVKLDDGLELVAIDRGRNEKETLVVGKIGSKDRAYVARFDGSAWVEVKVPFTDAPSSMSIGDDGSVWIATGHPHYGGKQPSKLWRADFPDLRFESVPIDPSIVVSKVKARNASDVWMVASTSADLDREALFHTQAPKPDAGEEEGGDPQRAVLSKKDPPPFYPGCVVPFILLGREEDVKEDEVKQLVASLGDWPHADSGVLVQVKSGKVWGLEISHERTLGIPARYQTMASTFATVKAKFPSAKLVCTRAKIEKSLDPPAKPKP
jgi:hypothetical protein